MTTRPVVVAPGELEALMGEFVAVAARQGYPASGEVLSILAVGPRFAGWQYRITREQTHGFVDCSALVSQSHWLGAALGLPFIAENQRLAYTATDGSDRELLPADVLVRYPSKADAPDGRHNHVVLFLGTHARYGPYVIESNPAAGVRARPLVDADRLGGVRRFVRDETTDFARAATALRYAAAVPKLGRLGARLVIDETQRHRGVDLAVTERAEVNAPISGAAVYERVDATSDACLVRIVSAAGDTAVALGPLDVPPTRASQVTAGESLGRVAGRPLPGCNAIPGNVMTATLHLEFWSSKPLPYFPERGLAWPASDGALLPYNAVYALKLDLIEPPVAVADVTSAFPRPPA